MVETLPLQGVERFINFDFENDRELLDIIELATAVTNTSFAAISFTQGDTVHIKVSNGISAQSIPEAVSFSKYVFKESGILIVNDTLADERFKTHTLVVSDPFIRFYAGVALSSGTHKNIGVFFVAHDVPGDLDHHQQFVLNILANQVMKIVELRDSAELLRRKHAELEEQKLLNVDANIRLRSFFESSTNFQVLLGKNGEVIDFNKTAVNFIKRVHSSDLKRGDQFVKYLHPEFVATFIDKYNLTLEGDKVVVEGSTDYQELGVIWWEASFEAARDVNNEIIGVSYLIRNVTERKLKEQKILAQNASLAKIAHIQAHEFRAPLTTIMGLVALIKEEKYDPPSEYIEMLAKTVDILDTTIRHVVSDIDGAIVTDFG
jgi:PAS domain S-box-containing protein